MAKPPYRFEKNDSRPRLPDSEKIYFDRTPRQTPPRRLTADGSTGGRFVTSSDDVYFDTSGPRRGTTIGIPVDRGNFEPERATAKTTGNRSSLTSSDSIMSNDFTMRAYRQNPGLGIQRDSYDFQEGRSIRDDKFKDVWKPSKSDSSADERAAHEAARVDAQTKAVRLSEIQRQRPGMIAVAQDDRGNAIGGHSIKGKGAQDHFLAHRNRHQGRVMDRIIAKQEPLDPLNKTEGKSHNVRGHGHGVCAEQPITHNIRYIRQQQAAQREPEDRPMFGGNTRVTAYRDVDKSGTYREPTRACGSCNVSNNRYNFQDDSYRSFSGRREDWPH